MAFEQLSQFSLVPLHLRSQFATSGFVNHRSSHRFRGAHDPLKIGNFLMLISSALARLPGRHHASQEASLCPKILFGLLCGGATRRYQAHALGVRQAERCTTQTISKDTAAINHLFRTSVPGVASDALEIAFSKHESRVAPILTRWGKPGVIPEIPDMKEVSIFLALLHLRNPKTALWYEAMAETISLERTKAAARDSDLFDKLWEMLVAKKPFRPTSPKRASRETT